MKNLYQFSVSENVGKFLWQEKPKNKIEDKKTPIEYEKPSDVGFEKPTGKENKMDEEKLAEEDLQKELDEVVEVKESEEDIRRQQEHYDFNKKLYGSSKDVMTDAEIKESLKVPEEIKKCRNVLNLVDEFMDLYLNAKKYEAMLSGKAWTGEDSRTEDLYTASSGLKNFLEDDAGLQTMRNPEPIYKVLSTISVDVRLMIIKLAKMHIQKSQNIKKEPGTPEWYISADTKISQMKDVVKLLDINVK